MQRIAVPFALSLVLLAPAADTAAQLGERLGADDAWCAPDRALDVHSAARPEASFAPACLPGEAPVVASRESARRGWTLAAEVLASPSPDPVAVANALVALESTRAFAPELSDRIALLGARLEHALGATRTTCARYEEAIESPLSSIAAQARVGHVLCLLEIGDRHAEDELAALERRYHELPMVDRLHLAHAEALERWSRTSDAIAIYREIDLERPGSPEAREARAHLTTLAASGVRVRGLTQMQEVERAERLVRSGPPDLARAEVERLRGLELPQLLTAEVALLAARIARVEGRFDDADALMREARGLEPEVGEDPATVATIADDLADAAVARDRDEALGTLRRMGFGRSLRRLSASRIYMMGRVAGRAGLGNELDALLDEELRRIDRDAEAESCVVRFDLAIVSAGTADDDRVARLLEGCEGSDARGVAVRYHRARALERLGRVREARRELGIVRRDDPSDTGFYALWAETRLAVLDGTVPENPFDALALDPVETETDGGETLATEDTWAGVPWSLGSKTSEARPHAPAPVVTPATPPTVPSDDAEPLEEEIADDAPPEPSLVLSEDDIAAALGALADEHGEAFPWLARARALVGLGATADAAEELFFVYEAAREADGHTPLRSGLESVYRGAAPARIPTSLVLRRARRALGMDDRRVLADVAASLGDFGLSTRFGGPGRAATRPRPYEPLVRAAAARHGVDPNLLWAVMRVESVYNPEIVSYAGAIGLMQIMPRTGRNIAHRLGLDDFTVADLLEPAVNIELSAWYLASLIERFDGRLPLAIAAYNGGPHNVRRWMEDHGRDLPVDALCERIPFDQTFRYVRRVLHHYAAYREGDGLSLPPLEPTMPGASVDHVAF